MQGISLISVSSYTFTGGLSASSVIPSDNLSNITLKLSGTVASGILYTVTADSARDCAGNLAVLNSSNFGIGDQPGFGDLVINEILADETPQVGLPTAEFIEIYNTTNRLIDLGSVILTDNSAGVNLPSTLLLPDSYLILTSLTAAPAFLLYGPTVAVPGFASLTNAGETLTLTTASGTFINGVAYSDTWHSNAIKKDGGWSLERVNPLLPCLNSVTNWRSSVNTLGGTPGSQNSVFSTQPDVIKPVITGLALDTATSQIIITFSKSLDSSSLFNGSYALQSGSNISLTQVRPQAPFFREVRLAYAGTMQPGVLYNLTVSNISDCSNNTLLTVSRNFGLGLSAGFGDIVINEIFADETPQVGLPIAEFIEIYNTTGQLIDLGTVVLSDNGSGVTLPAALLPPGGYLTLSNTSAAVQFEPFGPVLGISGFPSLTNSGKTLTLQTLSGTFINGVRYSDAWHSDAAKRDGGWSLERINPLLACVNNADNWRSSVNTLGGTPGSQNSVFSNQPDSKAPVLTNLILDTATKQIILTFDESLDSSSLANGNYVMQNGNLIITQVQPTAPLFDSVRLSYSGTVQQGVLYTLSVNGINDCSANSLAVTVRNFGLGVVPNYHDLIITEIFADETPQIGLPEGEFIEMYNRSDKVIETKGITLTDGGSTVTLTSRIILPGQYLILSSTARTTDFMAFGEALGVTGFPSSGQCRRAAHA